MTTSTDIAVRNGNAPAQPAGALAIRPGQTEWEEAQRAAFGQLGIADASDGDRAVFMHVSQRTGLDPFARQIYMIPRGEKLPNGQWGKKWTIQTGIEGWRVIRDRAERRYGVRGTLSRPVWYDDEGNELKVWVRPEAPAACELTYTVRDLDTGTETPYTSVLQFREYAQYKDGKLISQWAVKKSHMLEKCTEADVYRKAFPQDFSGIYLDDAMPPADDDREDGRQPERQRVTDRQIRSRRQAVPGTVEPQDPSPAGSGVSRPARKSPAPPGEPAGEAQKDEAAPAPAFRGQLNDISTMLERLGYAGDSQREARVRVAQKLAGVREGQALTYDLADRLLEKLRGMGDPTELAAALDDIAEAEAQDAGVMAAEEAARDGE